jgi:calcineurin-like phosphoesterase family protein
MKITTANLNQIWITSDTHAFHKNITRGTTEWSIDQRQLASGNVLGVRDFDTPEEMTQQLADNFNSVLPDNAILFHLGDWSFGGQDNIEKFRNMLNVRELHLVTGNHDHHQERGHFDHLFTSRQKYVELEVEKSTFCLFHFPIASWNGIRKGWYQLHGHQHWQGENRFGNGRQMDVGVDGNNLFPYKLTDVIDLLKDRRFNSEKDDHHG